MRLDVIWALVVFETRSMHDALALFFGLIVLGGGAAILIARKRDKQDVPLFRSVDKKEEIAQERHELVQQQTLETLLSAVESGRASLDPQMGLGAEPLRRVTETVQAAPAEPQEQPLQANDREGQKERRRAPRFAALDAEGLPQQTPLWVVNSRLSSARRAPAAASNPPADSASASGVEAGAKEKTEAAEKNRAPLRLPRLTDLRGTMFSTGIKELDVVRNGAEAGAEIERLKGPLPSLKVLLQRARERNGVDPQAAQLNALLAAKAEAAPAPAGETRTRDAAGQAATADPQQQVPTPEKAAKRKLDKDARQPFDRVEILPSQRGQYKRKDR